MIELPETGIILTGRAISGIGKATGFTQIPWVQEEFERNLGFRAWPGTFNLQVHLGASLDHWTGLSKLPGIPIVPPDASACVAACFPVLVEHDLQGMIVLPHVANYAPDQIEIVAEVSVRQRLGLMDGDTVTLHVRDWRRTVS